MHKIIAVLFSLVLIMALASFAAAGQVFQPEVTQAGPPLIQNNYQSNNVTSIDLLRGLIGYWPMEEKVWDGTAGEIKDSTGNGYNGQSLNGAFINASGKLGRGGGLTDASNMYVTIPNSIGALSAITTSIWYYPLTDTDWRTMVGGNAELYIRMATNKTINVWVDSLTTQSNSTTSVSTMNAWNHVMFVWDGVTSCVWINGSEESCRANTGSISINATSFFLGRQTMAQATRDFDGTLDEALMWDRALSDDEVLYYYNASRSRYVQ